MFRMVTFSFVLILCGFNASAAENVPQHWFTQWQNPSPQMRPLQIVHGGFIHRTTPEKMAYYRDECGLGGLVMNVGSHNYLYDEEQWTRFVEAVESAKKLGLRVWIYDEDGYPSPEAGGVVLRDHPELECLALVYDKEKEQAGTDPFHVRPAYEFTHAANNYAAARRYPNLLDPAATQRFIDVTHKQYRDRLGKELFEYVEAFFTDEPSMNAVNIGQIPEDVRKKVRVDDPVDPEIQPLPMVPWCNDLPEKYCEKFAEDLIPLRKSLFEGDSEKDKTVRRNFWTLLAELNSVRFYGAIQDWCKQNGAKVPDLENPAIPLRVASSGHTLHEEPTVAHPALDGNKIDVLCRMDVPGLDMLNSDPKAVFWGAWRAAVYPATAAQKTGRRLVMSEVSDFSQIMGGAGSVDSKTMCAACSWQAAWGVTEFTLYYGITKRGEETAEQAHRTFCDYIGRLNAVLREAKPVREVLLYYPITELQEEYCPQADPLDLKKQSQRMQKFVTTFENLGAELMRKQIPFLITDDRKNTEINGQKMILVETDLTPLAEKRLAKIEPANPWIVLSRFERDSRDIFLLLNTDDKPYEGKLVIPLRNGKPGKWTVWNPANGGVTDVSVEKTNENQLVPVKLEGKETLLFVGERR